MNGAVQVTEEEFRRLCEFLYRRTGMIFNETKRYYVERRIEERMAATGAATFPGYFLLLRGDMNGEVEQFINTMTVNETYFFREEQQLESLSAELLDARLRVKPQGEAIRIWSVPCSTGEEPYSIVMALLDAGLSSMQIRVDAMDISAQAVARGSRGEYGPNSFRDKTLDFRDRYFRRTAKGYCVDSQLAKMVAFRQGNLLLPELSFGKEPYDVIFCRNLLIYFDRLTQEQIMRTLGSLLASEGFLFVGGAETYLASYSGFTSVKHSMSFAFRKSGVSPPVPPLFMPSVVRPAKPAPRHIDKSILHATTANPRLIQPEADLGTQRETDLESARRLADSGRLQEAAEYCERHLLQQNSSPETYYLLGLIRDALGDVQHAMDCYRKLLYLDPDNVQALMHLALLTERRGDLVTAGRLRERVRRIELRTETSVS